MKIDNTTCQLNAESFYQCCCKCVYHRPIHFHCCTEPKPTEEEKKATGVEGSCVCGVQKGWACTCPMSDRIYDNWPEHSCGCELYTTKEDKEKWEKKNETT